MTDDDLAVAVTRLVDQVQHWTPARWARPASAGAGSVPASRADIVHALAQRLADAAADATGEPRRPVPRLANDLALPDQIRVLGSDLAAVPDARARQIAASDVRAVSMGL